MTTKGLRLRGPISQRIESSINRTEGCWLWRRDLDRSGYGKLWSDGRYQRAHRLAYEAWVGPIPDGMQLDHRCHTEDKSCKGGVDCAHRRCVNPAHLEPVTALENWQRGEGVCAINAAKTHCKRGHAFDEANTYVWRRSRICRQCRRGARGPKGGTS